MARSGAVSRRGPPTYGRDRLRSPVRGSRASRGARRGSAFGFEPARGLAHAARVRSAARSFALRDLGLLAASAAVGVSGFLVRT